MVASYMPIAIIKRLLYLLYTVSSDQHQSGIQFPPGTTKREKNKNKKIQCNRDIKTALQIVRPHSSETAVK